MADYELAKLEMSSPLINAAGTITGTSEEAILSKTEMLVQTGIGGLTFGSFTIPPQEDNEKIYGAPTYTHNQVTGETHNSEGLPNIGKDAAVALASEIVDRAHDHGKVVIYSGSPTKPPEGSDPKELGDSVEQAIRLAEAFLATDVDFVEVNVSCPNVVIEGGARKPIMGYDLEAMAGLVVGLVDRVGEGQRLGLKLPPFISPEEKALMPNLAIILRYHNVFRYLVGSNTIPNQVATYANGTPILSVPGGFGGLSGPATKEVGREQLQLWRHLMGESIDIVSALGVDSGEEVAERLKMGAVAVEAATLFTESRNWPSTVSRVLQEYANTVE